MTTTTMHPADVLDEAADLLLIRGRCLLDGMDHEGRYCVLGAIGEVLGVGPHEWKNFANRIENQPAVRALAWHLWTTGVLTDPSHSWAPSVPWHAVTLWNDCLVNPDDDFTVIDTLRRVAKDIRNAAA